MKKYKSIDELHAAIEKKAKQTIKSYYTDWKNYDRPALMKATGNRETVYIILRKYGSYFYTVADLLKSEFSRTVMDYYTTDESAKYYRVNLYSLTLEEIAPGLPEEIKNMIKEKAA